MNSETVDILCPGCKTVRKLAAITAKKYHRGSGADAARLCRSCSRKVARGRMQFVARSCESCGVSITPLSGATRFCDKCAGRAPKEPRECVVCGKRFIRYKNAAACSVSCVRRVRMNESYFGGRLFMAVGWKERVCQLCGRHVPKRAHIHHVFGHPDHSLLVVLCAGCHDSVSQLAHRKGFEDEQFFRLAWFAKAQRLGRVPDGPVPGHLTEAIPKHI